MMNIPEQGGYSYQHYRYSILDPNDDDNNDNNDNDNDDDDDNDNDDVNDDVNDDDSGLQIPLLKDYYHFYF